MSAFDVDAAARGSPGKIGLIAGDERLDYEELARRTARARAHLAELPPGARVALGGAPSVDVIVGLYAIWSRGLAAVPLHPRLAPRERRELLDQLRPDRIVEDDELAHAAAPAALAAPPRGSEPSSGPGPNDVLACLASSGTTGRPKVAELTRGAFAASAVASGENLGWLDDDRWLCCMPLAHVGGLSIATRCLAARATVVLVPKFDEGAVLEAIERHRVTMVSVVPTMLERLIRADDRDRLRLPRAILVGGAPARSELLLEAYDRGLAVLTTYGLTEACSQVTCQSPNRARSLESARSCGRPLSGIEVAVLGADRGPVAAGTEGGIHVRGPTLMRGYAGESPIAPDAWFDTGDVGRFASGGELEVLDRRVDLIVSGGENVYPSEVEDRLRSIDEVANALVFGVADDRWGQLVAAALLPQGSDIDLRALSVALAEELSPYKRPRLVCVVPSLPRTEAGKLDRPGAARRLGPGLVPLGRAAG